MARNFYYGSDASMVSGSALFATGIGADPEALGLTSAQSLAYSEVNARLQEAYRVASCPMTNSTVAVSEKNDAVKAMQRMAKNLSDIIRSQPEVSDAQLTALGLLPRPVRTRRHVPQTRPWVSVLAVVGRRVTVRICEPDSASQRTKPFGAVGAQVFCHEGEQPPAQAEDYRFLGTITRTKAEFTFPDDVASGATIWLSARWVSARGETGTASQPMSFTLQGGIPVPAATNGTRLAA